MLADEMPTCKNCGSRFDSNADGSKCPQCGSTSKVFSVKLNAQISIYTRWKMAAKRNGKLLFELISGFELFKKVNRMVRKSRLIDKENNWYEETITDPKTGKVIHQTKEKLTDHFGHGSAKPKKRP